MKSIVEKNPDKIGNHADQSQPQMPLHYDHQESDHQILRSDSSAACCDHRGYRTATNIAPLNEVLAAGLIQLSGWNGNTDFLDPMCGSGTLVIEAAMFACNVPANINRKLFAFEKWTDWDADLFEKIQESQLKKIINPSIQIKGSDKSPSAIEKALVNIKNINLKDTKIDLLSLSAHKFYGPKGVGALYIKNGVKLLPTYYGGGQEKDLRPGTENIAYIHGMSVALEIAVRDHESWHKKLSGFEALFLNNLNTSNIRYTLNGENLIGGILSITFHDILSQDLVIALDMRGYAISGGSACSSGSVKSSATLREIDMNEELAKRTVRISFGKNIQKKNIIGLSNSIADIVKIQNTKRSLNA